MVPWFYSVVVTAASTVGLETSCFASVGLISNESLAKPLKGQLVCYKIYSDFHDYILIGNRKV